MSEHNAKEQTPQDREAALCRDIERLHLQIRELQAALGREKEFSAGIMRSKSWRLTRPLREMLTYAVRLKTLLSRLTGRQIRKHQGGDSSITAHQLLQTSDTETGFDSQFYTAAYPDVLGDPLTHYRHTGKNEGRLARAPELLASDFTQKLDLKKENVLLVTHDSSRSGVPILTANIAFILQEQYNVILLPLQGGRLFESFSSIATIVLPPFADAYSSTVASAVLAPLFDRLEIRFAIVNSIVSRSVLSVLAEHAVPSLCLVHEFTSYVQPKSAPLEVQLWASRMIFSARIVWDNAVKYCPELAVIPPLILPQGRCRHFWPTDNLLQNAERASRGLRTSVRPKKLGDDGVVVLGIGNVEVRKGTDLFIATAQKLVALKPERPVRFVWVGRGFQPDKDMEYSVYLQDQIERANLQDSVHFLGEVDSVDDVCAAGDIFLLSSRLDPLPNVAIDAMHAGLPVLCFDHTSGIAEILKKNDLIQDCVIPYLDVDAAARLLKKLVDNPSLRSTLGDECRQIALETFDMRRYVAQLVATADSCLPEMVQEKLDCTFLLGGDLLDIQYGILPWDDARISREKLVRRYIRSWRTGVMRRKPFAGFHPGVFAELNGIEFAKIDPTVSYISAGRPAGPWRHEVITPDSEAAGDSSMALRTALHIHCFYPELLEQIFARIQRNSYAVDLYISVADEESRATVYQTVSRYRAGEVTVEVFPNRGRDIGPMLTGFGEVLTSRYELIGHIHTKKSISTNDAGVIAKWNDFLMENLLGGRHPMMDIIVSTFAADTSLGLVYADDPYIGTWGANRSIARALAHELDIADLPRYYLDYPVGTMFWARTEALRPLVKAGYGWERYPEEPISSDGTMLHAIERLLPIITRARGYQCKVTSITGVTR